MVTLVERVVISFEKEKYNKSKHLRLLSCLKKYFVIKY